MRRMNVGPRPCDVPRHLPHRVNGQNECPAYALLGMCRAFMAAAYGTRPRRAFALPRSTSLMLSFTKASGLVS
jgi:hypothetical protein